MDYTDLYDLIDRKTYTHEQTTDLAELYEPYIQKGFTEDITGNAVTNDYVVFARAVFAGNYRKPKFSHYEIVCGKIINDSYGKSKGQHTFTIQTNERRVRIKGRNLYKYLTLSKLRNNVEREKDLEDKYNRARLNKVQLYL